MRKNVIYNRTSIKNAENSLYENGETIEQRIRRIVESKEPIDDASPQIFTDKKDGVLPAYDIRTDKWDIAQQAMDLATRQEIAQSANANKVEPTTEPTTEPTVEPTVE